MVTLSLLCTALLLVACALLVEHNERLDLQRLVSFLEYEGERSQARLSKQDIKYALQGGGMWPMSERAIASAFGTRYLGWKPTQTRRTRQYIIAHVLGRCGNNCPRCAHTGVWVTIARAQGRLDRWIGMAS